MCYVCLSLSMDNKQCILAQLQIKFLQYIERQMFNTILSKYPF